MTRLAAPLALAQVGQVTMGVVDVAMVGRLGAVPLAAVGVGNALFFAVSVIGFGAMMGLDPLISQALGGGDHVQSRRLLWQGLWLSIVVGGILAIPIAVLPLGLEAFGVAADISSEARGYVWVRLWSLVPLLVFAALRSYLQAHQRTRPLLVAVVAANLLNYVLDRLLVFGGAQFPIGAEALAWVPQLGSLGAAWATLGCTILQVVFLLWAVRAIAVPGFIRSMRAPEWRRMWKALMVGMPVGLQLGAEVGVFALAGVLAARIGAEAGAAHQLAITLASVSFCASMGVASAGAVRVGHAIGGRDAAGTRRAGISALLLGTCVMGISAIVFVVMPETLARTLTDKPEVLAAAVPLLAVAAAFQLSDGLQAVGAGILRGAGDTRFAFVANLFGHYAVGLPVALVVGFVFDRGLMGIWIGLAGGLTAVAAVLVFRFLRLSRKEIRPLASTPTEAALPS